MAPIYDDVLVIGQAVPLCFVQKVGTMEGQFARITYPLVHVIGAILSSRFL
jgi:hypothetical protein